MKTVLRIICCAMLIASVGCSDNETNNSSSNEPTGKEYLAAKEPANVMPVGEARQKAKNGDAIALVGHIGGSKEPFVDGLAAFTIVDPVVPYCQPDENCPTPWDYCCKQNEVKTHIATVKVVDTKGLPVEEDARKLLGVKELSLVVVEGKLKVDDQGNMMLLANKVFVKE